MYFHHPRFSQGSEEEEEEEEEGESKADDPYAHLSKKEKKKLKKQVRSWSKLGAFDFFNIPVRGVVRLAGSVVRPCNS